MEKKKEVYCLNCMRKYEDDGFAEQLCSECRRKLGSVYRGESESKSFYEREMERIEKVRDRMLINGEIGWFFTLFFILVVILTSAGGI